MPRDGTLRSKGLAGCLAGALVLLAWDASLQAKVPADEAARLSADLTPLGATRAGNPEGTIPRWEGGIVQPPEGYQPGMHHPDPFAGDQIAVTITAANVGDFADQLSAGQRAMFERYPDTWRMPVYPSRRSASYPQRVYDATVANATSAELTDSGNGVADASGGVPFPIPKQGVEVIWNHMLRYRGESLEQTAGQAVPTAAGRYSFVRIEQKAFFPYHQPGANIESINNRSAYFLQSVTAPARLAGNILLVHETLDQVQEPRKAWTYNPGQRRVRRAPNNAYDNPGTASDGQRTTDMFDMFNGAPDRYEWTLLGKREMYVPYNAYRLHSADLSYDDILLAGHLNPEHLRYELHRVWVVDAKLREGFSHIYPRRTFYVDEDSWQILLVDLYDRRGEIWRVSEAHVINYYEVPLLWDTVQVHYDVQNISP
jgi:hypothetical protein